jgi:hypothetical protein
MCVSSAIHRHRVFVRANRLCSWFLQCTGGLTGVFCTLFRQICISLRCDGARSNSSKMGWLGDVFAPWRRVLVSSKALEIDSTGYYLSSRMHVRQLLRQVQSRVATPKAAGRWWGVCYSRAIHRHQVLVWIDRPCNRFLQGFVSLVIVFCSLFVRFASISCGWEAWVLQFYYFVYIHIHINWLNRSKYTGVTQGHSCMLAKSMQPKVCFNVRFIKIRLRCARSVCSHRYMVRVHRTTTAHTLQPTYTTQFPNTSPHVDAWWECSQ